MSPRSGGSVLYERDHELAAIERTMTEGGAVLIVGSFGMGKSSIVAAARRLALAAGAGVAVAQGAEPEQGYRGGVVRQLVDSALATAFDARRPASPSTTLDDVLGALEARGRSVCVIVDDLQWVDEPSLEALHAGSGWSGMAFVGSLDPAPGAAQAIGRTLRHMPSHRLEPLSARAVGSMLEGAFGHPISEPLADGCRAATGGRPVLVQQLIDELRRRGEAPSASALAALVDRPPPSVRRTVARSLKRLPHEAQQLAAALAVAGGDAPATTLGRLAGLDEAAVAASATRLREAELLVTGDAFGAPLVGAAIAASLPLRERSALHAGVAELLLGAGAPHGDVARHILQAPQHAVPGAGAVLANAVADAQDRGEPQSVVRYLQRALEEAPEPAPEVVAALGSGQLRLGRIGEATATLTRALDTITEPEDCFRAAAELGCALVYQGRAHEAMRVVADAAAAARELRSDAAHVLEATQALAGWCDLDVFRQLRGAVPLMRHEPQRPRSLGDHVHAGQLAAEHALHGSATAARRLAGQASVEPLASARHLLPFHFRELALALADDPAATAELARVEAAARVTDSDVALRIAHAMRATAHLRRGELDAVERLGATAAGPLVAVHLAECRLERGLLEEAEDALASPDAPHFGWRDDLFRPLTLGRLRVRQGRAHDALSAFRRCAQAESQWGFSEPAHACWRAEAALVHHFAGDAAQARALAAEAVDRTRRYDAERLHGMALRAAARVGAVGPADALLEQAVDILDRVGAPLEAARARADLGSLLRRLGRVRDARAPLAAARETARALGAAPLATFASQELGLSGEGTIARRDRDALTPAERRIAALAADGLKNREIAATLLISEKTVELQLTRTYRKLGISSRKQLASALGD